MSKRAAALRSEIAYRKYLQWIAAEQWAEAKRLAWPTRIFGDLPFMISADSPDVWARQAEFRFDATIGVPPDAFSETGQDWGLPPWRWDVMAANDFAWMRARARRMPRSYDGFRIDHLVGLYRTYIRPIDKTNAGVLRTRRRACADRAGRNADRNPRRRRRTTLAASDLLIAEDLGVIPPFVRESMARLDLPGLKVLRWERHWDRRPAANRSARSSRSARSPPRARTTSSRWRRRRKGETEEQRAAVLRALLSAGSCLTLIPLQDVFGWAERINTPAVVDEINWTWRLPGRSTLARSRRNVERADALKAWTREADDER